MSEQHGETAPQFTLSWLRHEMMTPLNHIIGYSEMLQEEAEDLEQVSFVDDIGKINQAARRLVGLITENLIESKLDIIKAGSSILDDLPKKSGKTAGLFETLVPSKPRYIEPDHGDLLVVDDNEENRQILSRQLEKQGYTVTMAENGRQALDLIRGKKFDLVLLDILMPEMNGVQVLQHLKDDEELRHIPVIMISALDEMDSVIRCIEMGAEEYLPKPFDPVLLRARIGASLEKKRLRDQEQVIYQALVKTQESLTAELAEAADYVKSLLPEPLSGEISTEWEYIPSTQLGGDAFGYHRLDDDHFSMYLLDVCGHGVGAALHSISIMNVIRSQSFADVDFKNPAEVLKKLNATFNMMDHNFMFFTMWYGVFNRKTRQLVYANGGHPPAILITGQSASETRIEQLSAPGMALGAKPSAEYQCATVDMEAGGKLFIYSDGAFEIEKPDGEMLTMQEFIDELVVPNPPDKSDLERIMEFARGLRGGDSFDDDVSIVKFVFT